MKKMIVAGVITDAAVKRLEVDPEYLDQLKAMKAAADFVNGCIFKTKAPTASTARAAPKHYRGQSRHLLN